MRQLAPEWEAYSFLQNRNNMLKHAEGGLFVSFNVLRKAHLGRMVEMKRTTPDLFTVFGNEGVVKTEDQVLYVESFDNGFQNRYPQCLRLPLRVVEKSMVLS
jgi:hypothetical protein